MIEAFIHANTLPEAYHSALLMLQTNGEIVPCPDYNTTQKELTMTICIEHPLVEPMISRLFIGGFYELEQYRQEILDGILDFEIDKGNWAYTYHDRIGYQEQFIVDELKRNPYSRRAVIDVRRLSDMKTDDPACLQHIQYFIRDDKLHCKVLFRSNDACKATFMNAFALIMLQKRIADKLGIEVGTYSHRANSFHCYEKDFDLLSGYAKRIYGNGELTYNYVGEWEELMESAKPMIAEKIQSLKNN